MAIAWSERNKKKYMTRNQALPLILNLSLLLYAENRAPRSNSFVIS